MRKNIILDKIIIIGSLMLLSMGLFACGNADIRSSLDITSDIEKQLKEDEDRRKNALDEIRDYALREETSVLGKYHYGENNPKENIEAENYEKAESSISEESSTTLSKDDNSRLIAESRDLGFLSKAEILNEDPESQYLFFREYETSFSNLNIGYLKKRNKNEIKSRYYIRYAIDTNGQVTVFNDYIMPEIPSNGFIVDVDQNGTVVAIDIGEGNYIKKYYTPDGVCYRTLSPTGNRLVPYYKTAVYDGKTYLVSYGGGQLTNYVYVDPNVGIDITVENFLKGEAMTTITKEEAENNSAIVRDNVINANKIQEKIKDDIAKKYAYQKATQMSESIKSSDQDLLYLNELAGSDGYVDYAQGILEGEHGLDFSLIQNNPKVIRSLQKLKETDYCFLKDGAGVIHSFLKTEATKYLDEMFEYATNEIASSPTRYKANTYKTALSNTKLVQAGETFTAKFNNSRKSYVKLLEKQIEDKFKKVNN